MLKTLIHTLFTSSLVYLIGLPTVDAVDTDLCQNSHNFHWFDLYHVVIIALLAKAASSHVIIGLGLFASFDIENWT